MKTIRKKIIILAALVPFTFLSFGQAIQVDCDDNVGIGITPTEKLHINGSIRGNYTGGSLKINTEYGWTTMGPHSSGLSHFYTDQDYFFFHPGIKVNTGYIGSFDENLYLRTGNATRITIQYSNGYVGIGMTPSYKLDVNGYVRATNIDPSDSTLKTNIKSISKSRINDLYSIEGKTYQRKEKEPMTQELSSSDSTENIEQVDDYDNRFHFGLLAQEILSIYPELVFEDDEGILSLNYNGFIPIIIETLKEQKLIIDELHNELDNLKSDNNLKSEITNSLYPETEKDNLCNLYQNNPNPFNVDTQIKFRIPEEIKNSTLYIYNMKGSQVRSYDIQERGLSHVIIYGSELDPGMYLYSLIADGKEVGTKRMILTD